MRLRDIGENALIERIRTRFPPPEGVLGIGDDAAIFDVPAGQSLVFCSDLVVEDTHFLRTLHPADAVGYKAVAVNVSDVGAMGGVPMYFLISLAAPADVGLDWIDAFYDGVERACRDFGVRLLGGDASAADLILADVAMAGRVPQGAAVRRSGAQPGDGIYVTGALGASLWGLDLLRAGERDHPAVQRHLYPRPRHRIGAAVAAAAHAMIDISDGLSMDLWRIASASKVSARIYKEKIPAAPGAPESHVLHGGEEYELIIAAPVLPTGAEGVPITRIGEIAPSTAGNQVFLVEDNRESILHPGGWQHF